MMTFLVNEETNKDGKWLQGEWEQRLIEIRKRVKDLYKAKEADPQVKNYTIHGETHCQAVEDLLYRLIPGELHQKLSESEKFFLLASAWLHDIGMLKGILGDNDETIGDEALRDNHHSRSEEYIIKNYLQLGVLEHEKEALGILARFHRRRLPLEDCSEDLQIHDHHLRIKLLAAYLRLADALHIDQTRAPDVQYAISLAYDIPNRDKEHWLKSKFVLGMEIDAEKKEITVHLKRPTDKDTDKTENWVDTLNIIYDQIVQDINAELESVKNVLISAGITYFLSIKKKVHKVEFDKRMRNDYKNVFKQYDLLDNPSSSALSKLVLQSIDGIIDSKEDDMSTASLPTVSSFLDEVEERILLSRKCHSGLRNLVDEIRDKVKEGDIKVLKSFIKYRIWVMEQKSKAVRFSAYRYFREALAKLSPDMKAKDAEILLEGMMKEGKKFNILLYGYSELAIKCLCGFRDAIITQLENDYNKDNNIHYEKVEFDCDPLFGPDEKKEIPDGKDAKSKLEKEIQLISQILEILKAGTPVELRRDHIFVIFEKNIENSEIRKVFEIILSKDKLKNIAKEITCAEETRKISELDKRCIKKILEKVLDNNEAQKAFNNYLVEQNISEILIKIRHEKIIQFVFEQIENEKDAVKKNKLKNKYDRLLLIHHEKEWEERAADYFRIFVCEGQPKNRTSWGGRIYYHDGAQYALRISSSGFTNIFIIPDATAASLIVPYNQCSGFPKIDYVLVGANGYDNIIFRHSAGHATVSSITSFSRVVKNSNYKEYLYGSDLNGTKSDPPVLILTLTTDKYDPPHGENPGAQNKKDGYDKKTTDKKDNAPIITDGWLFQGPFAGEDKRTHVFISQDTDLRKKLESKKIRFYNPREDKIPIKLVDVVITEKAWIEKEEDKVCDDKNGKEKKEIEREEDKIYYDKNWNGRLITDTDKDPSKMESKNRGPLSDNASTNENQKTIGKKR